MGRLPGLVLLDLTTVLVRIPVLLAVVSLVIVVLLPVGLGGALLYGDSLDAQSCVHRDLLTLILIL